MEDEGKKESSETQHHFYMSHISSITHGPLQELVNSWMLACPLVSWLAGWLSGLIG